MADNRYPRKPEFQPAMKSPEGKLPPHDTELEEVVLGALMLEKEAKVWRTRICRWPTS